MSDYTYFFTAAFKNHLKKKKKRDIELLIKYALYFILLSQRLPNFQKYINL